MMILIMILQPRTVPHLYEKGLAWC